MDRGRRQLCTGAWESRGDAWAQRLGKARERNLGHLPSVAEKKKEEETSYARSRTETADKRTWQGVGCRGFSVRGSEMRERGESALRSTEARQREDRGKAKEKQLVNYHSPAEDSHLQIEATTSHNDDYCRMHGGGAV